MMSRCLSADLLPHCLFVPSLLEVGDGGTFLMRQAKRLRPGRRKYDYLSKLNIADYESVLVRFGVN